MDGGKRPWHRLASSAISLVCYLTQLIYSKPYIHIFPWRKNCVYFLKKCVIVACVIVVLIYSKTTICGFKSQPVPGLSFLDKRIAGSGNEIGARAFSLPPKGPGNEVGDLCIIACNCAVCPKRLKSSASAERSNLNALTPK